MRHTILTLLLFLISTPLFAAEPLRVLAIGNSFSEDALEQELWPLCHAGGRDIIIGNLYFPGCSIERHYNNMTTDKGEYSYRKIGIDGRVDTIADCSISRALADEKWDYITFQQASHLSGKYETYDKLPGLIKSVRETVGDKPIFLWHMTWAYSTDSKHDGFKNYGNDQVQMYDAIVKCAKSAIEDNPELKGIIPSGTAVQNARTSAMGSDLTRDGYHLHLLTGRYIAACTWFDVLFGTYVSDNSYAPSGMNNEQRRVSQASADAAVKHPFEIQQIK